MGFIDVDGRYNASVFSVEGSIEDKGNYDRGWGPFILEAKGVCQCS